MGLQESHRRDTATKGACPTNMVLQTSCRCLRQVVRHEHETALIWLNAFNAEKLNRQLLQQQNITLRELGNKPKADVPLIDRYSRMENCVCLTSTSISSR